MLDSLLQIKVTDADHPQQVAAVLGMQPWSQGCVIQMVDGIRWLELGRVGGAVPDEASLQLALDSDEIVGGTDWLCFACRSEVQDSAEQYCVAIQCTDKTMALETLTAISKSLLNGILQWHRHQQLYDRVLRTETILQIAAQWHGIKQTDQLISEIVEASTQLLSAERASLFLWDQ